MAQAELAACVRQGRAHGDGDVSGLDAGEEDALVPSLRLVSSKRLHRALAKVSDIREDIERQQQDASDIGARLQRAARVAAYAAMRALTAARRAQREARDARRHWRIRQGQKMRTAAEIRMAEGMGREAVERAKVAVAMMVARKVVCTTRVHPSWNSRPA